MALEATDSNFDELVLQSAKPVIVDFWAEWCGPCRMVGPIVEEVGVEYEGKAEVGYWIIHRHLDGNINCCVEKWWRTVG